MVMSSEGKVRGYFGAGASLGQALQDALNNAMKSDSIGEAKAPEKREYECREFRPEPQSPGAWTKVQAHCGNCAASQYAQKCTDIIPRLRQELAKMEDDVPEAHVTVKIEVRINRGEYYQGGFVIVGASARIGTIGQELKF